ncbi:MAG: DEAD/DEAH box helicase [Candidatus Thiodiazotropha sp.]
MFFSATDLSQLVPEALLNSTQQWLDSGANLTTEARRGGELITAIVTPPDETTLRLYIRLSRVNQQLRIEGECPCDEEGLCIHILGALLHVLQSRESPTDTHIPPRECTLSRAPTPSRQCLIYLCNIEQGQLCVETWVARRLPESGYELTRRFEPGRTQTAHPPRFLEPADLEILQDLAQQPKDPRTQRPTLTSHSPVSFLKHLIATHRCHFQSADTSALHWGEAEAMLFEWYCDPFGRQGLQWHPPTSSLHLMALEAPVYLDPDHNTCGLLECVMSGADLWQTLNHPPLGPEPLNAWLADIHHRYPAVDLPAPRNFIARVMDPVAPTPCLCFTSVQQSAENVHSGRYEIILHFDYAGIPLTPTSPDSWLQDDELVTVQRDHPAESATLATLSELGLEVVAHREDGTCLIPTPVFPQTEEQAWVAFQQRSLVTFREAGWRVRFDNFPLRTIEPDQLNVQLQGLDSQDWLSLSMDITLQGHRTSLLPLVFRLIETPAEERAVWTEHPEQEVLIPMRDDQGEDFLLRLRGERACQIVALLTEICRRSSPLDQKILPIGRGDLARLAVLDADDSDQSLVLAWDDERERQLVETLRKQDHFPTCTPPETLQASLRPYQQEGLNWLQFLTNFHLAGILADDMGLGKTIQTLAHMLSEKQAGRLDLPSLIVMPTSLIFNWRDEAARFAPSLSLLVLQGAERKRRFADLCKYDLVITTYTQLIRDFDSMQPQRYHLLILDEAQTIKNPKSQAAQCVRQLMARHRLCLTGTPLENHLGELWSLFDFLMPGLLGGQRQFRREFRVPIEQEDDQQARERLRRRIRPFLLRRTKQQVAQELPEKIEIVHRVQMQEAQRESYEMVRLAQHQRVRELLQREGLARNTIMVFDALLKLRQVCCDPRLLNSDQPLSAADSAKLAHLMGLLPEMIDEGRRILLFSQFTSMLTLIEEALLAAKIPYVTLTGTTRDREKPVRRFQDGEVPLFLISLKAGGVGLNLTAADTVIHYDPWWNPAAERQATDRSHRIGQQHQVFVYKLICSASVEEKILAMQQHKQSLADGIYENVESLSSLLTEIEIESLFSAD